jgi:hypothetical protein
MMRRLLMVVLLATVAACGDDDSSGSPTSPSGTSSVTVTVSSPLRMGQTAQAAGTETLSNGQTRPITTGWQSDAPAVATVTGAGLVTGVANGRATIYVVAGGRQGQQVLRVVPDYHGVWDGALRVTSCTESGIFAQVSFCNEFPVGSTSGYQLRLSQSGELMTAIASYGPTATFPGVAAPVREDGTSTFTPTLSITDSGITLTVDATFAINSVRVGELTGTVSELWRVPNVSGEGRLVQAIVSTARTSTTPLWSGRDGAATRFRLLRKLAQDH